MSYLRVALRLAGSAHFMENRETPAPIAARRSERVGLPTFATGDEDAPVVVAVVPPAGGAVPVRATAANATRIALPFSDN